MGKMYTESELRDMGMDEAQIKAVMSTQHAKMAEEMAKQPLRVISDDEKVVKVHHDVDVHTESTPLVPTTIKQLSTYKGGTVVELPSFADGQPFVARLSRPSMRTLIKSGKIPNSLINQATSLFANGASALNSSKNQINIDELYGVVDIIVESALLEPTLKDIQSVGMELTDEQVMAIFSYTQRGVKALEQFRPE